MNPFVSIPAKNVTNLGYIDIALFNN
jgi:hypothetical protein